MNFNELDVVGAQMVIDRVVLAIIWVAIGWFALRVLVPKGIQLVKRAGSYMKELTSDFSGEDADQCVGAMDPETRARLEKLASMSGNRIMTGNSLPPSVQLAKARREDEQAALKAAAVAERVLIDQKLAMEKLRLEIQKRKGMCAPGSTVMYKSCRSGWRKATVASESKKRGKHNSFILALEGRPNVRVRRHVSTLLTLKEYNSLAKQRKLAVAA